MSLKIYIDNILPISIDSSIANALDCFANYNQNILPVIDSSKVIGYISENEIKNIKKSTLIRDINIHPIVKANVDFHFYELIPLFKNKNNIVAVEDNQGNYLGCATYKSTIQILAEHYGEALLGSIIVVKNTIALFSLADITRIIESNNARVILLHIENIFDENTTKAHIKINTSIIRPILNALERYGYTIVEHRNSEDIDDDIDYKYQLFLKYIDT